MPEQEYLRKLPAVVPADRVLVHNHVRPTRRLGSHGFRAWLQPSDPARLQACACEWASELGRHFRLVTKGGV